MLLPTLFPWGSMPRPLLAAARIGVVGLMLGLLLLGMAGPARAFTAGDTLGTVTMGSNTTLSAAVYDSSGQIVCRLYQASPQTGTVTLTWDGRDDQGNLLPGGNYQWRAITTSAVGQDSGDVGNDGDPPYPPANDPCTVNGVAYDSSGNLYMLSTYQEDCYTLRRINAANISTGTTAWEGYGMAGGSALATDGVNVYFSTENSNSVFGNISSYNASNGTATSGWTTIAASTGSIPGLAVDNADLWVSDMAGNQVELYNKSTGAFITSIAVTGPRGIAADGSGNAWVACAGSSGSVIQLKLQWHHHQRDG